MEVCSQHWEIYSSLCEPIRAEIIFIIISNSNQKLKDKSEMEQIKKLCGPNKVNMMTGFVNHPESHVMGWIQVTAPEFKMRKKIYIFMLHRKRKERNYDIKILKNVCLNYILWQDFFLICWYWYCPSKIFIHIFTFINIIYSVLGF